MNCGSLARHAGSTVLPARGSHVTPSGPYEIAKNWVPDCHWLNWDQPHSEATNDMSAYDTGTEAVVGYEHKSRPSATTSKMAGKN